MEDNSRTWQDLRAMRASPVGLAATDPERRGVFSSALRQAQELADSASVAGYATKPLPLFYCLSQGVRALAAATVEDEAWRVRGHGASIEPAPNLMETQIIPKPRKHPDKQDALSALQAVEAASPLVEPMTLAALWAATPSTPEIESGPSDHPIPLSLHLPPQKPRQVIRDGRIELAVEGLSIELSDEALAAALSPYPSLEGGEPVREHIGDDAAIFETDSPQTIYSANTRMLTLVHQRRWMAKSPVLTWQVEGDGDDAYQAKFEALAPVAFDSRTDARLVFPAIGGSSAPSFTALWLTFLLALSSLVRYEPSLWTEAADPDHSPLAVPLEQVCDFAESFVPTILRSVLLRVEDP